MRSKDRNYSLVDNSMRMVVNIIKLSSYSIANVSLGAARLSTTAKDLGPTPGSITGDTEPLLPQFLGSQKSGKSWTSSKPTFLMEPSGGDKSSCVNTMHEEENVDRKASEFITWVHQKNKVSSQTSNLSEVILPPPPRAIM